MEIKHEADVMQVYLQSQTCCSAKCELNKVKIKHEAETNEACFSLLTCCSAKCELNKVKAQLSEQLTIDLGDPFMGSK